MTTKVPEGDTEFDEWLARVKDVSPLERVKEDDTPDSVIKLKRRPFQNWTDDEIDAETDIDFLIGDERRPVLGEGALWQVFGKKKTAKTLYCLEMAFCIAFGIPFHGLPTKQGPVIYILAEGGAKRNYKRLRALWLKHEEAMIKKGYTSLKDAREKT